MEGERWWFCGRLTEGERDVRLMWPFQVRPLEHFLLVLSLCKRIVDRTTTARKIVEDG